MRTLVCPSAVAAMMAYRPCLRSAPGQHRCVTTDGDTATLKAVRLITTNYWFVLRNLCKLACAQLDWGPPGRGSKLLAYVVKSGLSVSSKGFQLSLENRQHRRRDLPFLHFSRTVPRRQVYSPW